MSEPQGIFEFRLPDIGEGVVEGEIVKWLVKEGDAIAEDQPLVEVMTDKATVTIPSPKKGRVPFCLSETFFLFFVVPKNSFATCFH
jgi:pyruvate/2-oxoglutarate dehydrogenase complex dihydrolipoamide acyltransferase (E2) component